MSFAHLLCLQLISTNQRLSPTLLVEEKMRAAQEELGAAGPCSNLSGSWGGRFQGSYHVGSSQVVIYMQRLFTEHNYPHTGTAIVPHSG